MQHLNLHFLYYTVTGFLYSLSKQKTLFLKSSPKERMDKLANISLALNLFEIFNSILTELSKAICIVDTFLADVLNHSCESMHLTS
jgi:hypothetical protein